VVAEHVLAPGCDLRDITALAPQADPAAAAAEGGSASSGPAGGDAARAGTAPHVLLVEDNDVNRLIATELLQALGAHVVAVAGGEAALTACHTQPPELVLMDLQMPGMDGLEACRRLRELQRSSRLPGFPIVALTAHAMANDRAACLAAGMDGFLTKPIVIDALRSELGRWLPALA